MCTATKAMIVLLGVLAGVRQTQAVEVSSSQLSFLQLTARQNPMSRDPDLIPSSPNSKGTEASKGSLQFLLVTSFLGGTAGTGKVWVVPADSPEDSFVLVSGLDAPTGVCFDKNNDFLYVVDSGMAGEDGRVLQFQVDTDMDDRFVLADYNVATVYVGPNPFDCWVDAYGNLYFVDSQADSVNIVGYLDLWSGFVGRETTLYLRTNSNDRISSPVALEVEKSDTIFFINNNDPEDSGLLNEVSTRTQYLNQSPITTDVRVLRTPWGVAVSKNYAYYSTDDGSIWAYRRDNPNLFLKSSQFSRPRGLCLSDGDLYVADNDFGEVFRMDGGEDQDRNPEGIVRIQGAYEVYCVND